MSILFTCMGTSDPVRGYRDGPMLHILRHYRPERVYVFLTDEAAMLNKNGGRLEAVKKFVSDKWDYRPEFHILLSAIQDPSDLDCVSEPLLKEAAAVITENPAETILLNLSSGTPQMKLVLALLACDLRYSNLKAVQVKSPEKASGSTERTNAKAYSIELELEFNEDEQPEAENRCSEPQLVHLRRQQAKEQIFALLQQRNYSAIYTMKNSMPDTVKALIGHLCARDAMQRELAEKRAAGLKLPFPLYPAKPAKGYSDYSEVSEAYLVLYNRLHKKQYEEFVIRLNPLVVRLQLRILNNVFYNDGKKLNDVFEKRGGEYRFVPDRFAAHYPHIARVLRDSFASELREGFVNINLNNRILEQFPTVPKKQLELLECCEQLNTNIRNELAHQLVAATEQQLTEACGKSPYTLHREIGELIAELYPECDPELFHIYKDCEDYIRSQL